MARATKFDAQVVTDAGNANLPPNYLSLVEWSIRQAFGGIEITVSKDSTGAYNSSDATAFLKGIVQAAHLFLMPNHLPCDSPQKFPVQV